MNPHQGHARFLIAAGRLRAGGTQVKADLLKAEWESVDAVRRSKEGRMVRLYASLLREQKKAVLDSLPSLFAQYGGAQKRTTPGDFRIGSMLLDVATWLVGIREEFGPVLADVIEAGFRTGAVRVGTTLDVRVTPYAQTVLDEIVTKIQNTTITTQGEVGRIVRGGLNAQLDASDIARQLGRAFEDWTDTRASAVAETSVTSTFEAGQVEAFREAGIEGRRWLSRRDGKVRPAHDEADNQFRTLGAPFDVDGEALMFPGDPNGSAANVIRCRCTTLPVTRAKSWRGDRNKRIADDYPAMRKSMGQIEALSALAEREGLSERQIRRILWE